MIDKLIETAWVMWNYRFAEAAVGTASCITLALIASRCRSRRKARAMHILSVLLFWVGLYIATASSNAIWQQAPHAPADGFSTTGPWMVLGLGWIPGLMLSGFLYAFSRVMLPMDVDAFRPNKPRLIAKPAKESRPRWARGYSSGHGQVHPMQPQ